jgi:hypothetical protein
VTIARTVSDAFFFVFSHATCSGRSHTLMRSVFFPPPLFVAAMTPSNIARAPR